MAEEREVYIPSVIELLKNVFIMIPLSLRTWAAHLLVGRGMETFTGRSHLHSD